MSAGSIKLVPWKWQAEFEAWIDQVQERALLVSPYMAWMPIEMVVNRWASRGIINSVEARLFVDLSPDTVLRGSLEPSALLFFANAVPRTTVIQVHNLHAKVYVADESVAIITSGNLTKAGLDRNYEYGVRLSDPLLVHRVREDFRQLEEFASPVLASSLERWSSAAAELRPLQARVERTASRGILREFRRRIEEVEREVQRIRAQGQTDNSIFSRAIVRFLERHGPLTTAELHPLIQGVYPDLCDDRIDRVVDGVHFGKRWKHMVRNAQQHLKRHGRISLKDGRWYLAEQ